MGQSKLRESALAWADKHEMQRVDAVNHADGIRQVPDGTITPQQLRDKQEDFRKLAMDAILKGRANRLRREAAKKGESQAA